MRMGQRETVYIVTILSRSAKHFRAASMQGSIRTKHAYVSGIRFLDGLIGPSCQVSMCPPTPSRTSRQTGQLVSLRMERTHTNTTQDDKHATAPKIGRANNYEEEVGHDAEEVVEKLDISSVDRRRT